MLREGVERRGGEGLVMFYSEVVEWTCLSSDLEDGD